MNDNDNDHDDVDAGMEAAEAIDSAMMEKGIFDEELATVLRTEPEVIEAIRDGNLPVPLAWVPRLASELRLDSALLMEKALRDQWFPTLRSIAATLLWQQRDIEQEWLQIIADLHDGIVPDPVDVPDLLLRLKGL